MIHYGPCRGHGAGWDQGSALEECKELPKYFYGYWITNQPWHTMVSQGRKPEPPSFETGVPNSF